MKTELCSFCLKSGMLCQKCSAKVKAGEISELDLKIARQLLLLEEKYPSLQNVCFYKAVDANPKMIEVTAAKTGRAIVYHFKDPGQGFDADDLEHAALSHDPDEIAATVVARALKGLRPGGFGMLIARRVADELVYNEPRNEVLMIKYL